MEPNSEVDLGQDHGWVGYEEGRQELLVWKEECKPRAEPKRKVAAHLGL